MTDNPNSDPAQLEQIIGYTFNRKDLLLNALTHRSYANEALPQKIEDNERLEFLGDAVLGMLISHYLVDKHPRYSEGKLSKVKSFLVSKSTLAKIGHNLNLGEYLRLGKGEQSGLGQTKGSLLANALEAIIGAVYLDGGIERAKEFVLGQFAGMAYETAGRDEIENYKGILQELAQTELGKTPAYKLVRVTGPEHRRIFEIELKLNDQYRVSAQGYSKKQAEQEAARKLFEQVQQNRSSPTDPAGSEQAP